MNLKSLKRKDIEALRKIMPVLTEDEAMDVLGGHHVVIEVVRQGYGNDSTYSTFSVKVVGTCGQTEPNYPTMCGYMLEPRVDASLATTAGSDTAISSGSYGVYQRPDNKWELSGVPGRSNIQIHAGNTGAQTTGCFLVGSTYQSSCGNYSVGNSQTTYNQLNKILEEYGDMVTISVNKNITNSCTNNFLL